MTLAGYVFIATFLFTIVINKTISIMSRLYNASLVPMTQTDKDMSCDPTRGGTDHDHDTLNLPHMVNGQKFDPDIEKFCFCHGLGQNCDQMTITMTPEHRANCQKIIVILPTSPYINDHHRYDV